MEQGLQRLRWPSWQPQTCPVAQKNLEGKVRVQQLASIKAYLCTTDACLLSGRGVCLPACMLHIHTYTHSFSPPRLLPGLPFLSPSGPIFILLMYSAAMLPGSPEGEGSLGLHENSRSWSLIPVCDIRAHGGACFWARMCTPTCVCVSLGMHVHAQLCMCGAAMDTHA